MLKTITKLLKSMLISLGNIFKFVIDSHSIMALSLVATCLVQTLKLLSYFFFKFYETVIGNYLRKQMVHVPAYFFQIEMFQAAIAGIMEKNHDEHNFGF
jgi:hypothetical protein